MSISRQSRRPKLGDVIELRHSKGVVHAQFVNEHKLPPCYGELIRVFPPCRKQSRISINEIVKQQALYCCFFRVRVAVRQGLARIIGNAEIPPDYQTLPKFKKASLPFAARATWAIWDPATGKLSRVKRLSASQKKYPILEIVGVPDLIDRIKSGWLPEDAVHEHRSDPELRQALLAVISESCAAADQGRKKRKITTRKGKKSRTQISHSKRGLK